MASWYPHGPRLSLIDEAEDAVKHLTAEILERVTALPDSYFEGERSSGSAAPSPTKRVAGNLQRDNSGDSNAQHTDVNPPTAELVYDLLMSIYEERDLDASVDDVMEMRHSLRLIVCKLFDLAEEQVLEKTAFRQGVLRAVDSGHEGVNDVRYQTAKAVSTALNRSDWGPSEGDNELAPQHRATNTTLREVYRGIVRVIAELDEVLDKDGSKGEEVSDAEDANKAFEGVIPSARRQETASKSGTKHNKALNDKTLPPNDGDGTRRQRGKCIPWSKLEDLTLLQVEGDTKGSNEKKAVEFNRRMADLRSRKGWGEEHTRTAGGCSGRRTAIFGNGDTIQSLKIEMGIIHLKKPSAVQTD